MTNLNREEEWIRADDDVRKNLPPGIKLVRTLRGHEGSIGHIAWSPNGRLLASPSDDGAVRLWDVERGECMRIIESRAGVVACVAFDGSGTVIATGSVHDAVRLWDPSSGKLIRTLGGPTEGVSHIAFDPTANNLACAGLDGLLKLWNARSGKLHQARMLGTNTVRSLSFDPKGNHLAYGCGKSQIAICTRNASPVRAIIGIVPDGQDITALEFDPVRNMLASAGFPSSTIRLYNQSHGSLTRILESHTDSVNSISFSADGQLLASREVFARHFRVWRTDTWACVAATPAIGDMRPGSESTYANLAFHPHRPLLAVVAPEGSNHVIHIYELDVAGLLAQPAAIPAVAYTSAKIVLVGDSGVGKTGLGWRLAHGEFKEHSSTHGQQFWLLHQLCKERRDRAQCEAVLWDLAGQDDYRLIHALFLDDADLALVLFDPSRSDDPLSGVDYWLKQLKTGGRDANGTPTVLVAARSDRGTPRLTADELAAFCKQRGIIAYLPTSAKAGEGVEDLIRQMQNLIPWDDKPATITTETFKRIKDFVLDLKENARGQKVILTPDELRQRLTKTDGAWKFTNDEMLAAVGHLANHGYVARLETSQGEPRILLAPELLNNLAASFILEARRNGRGLGSLEEQELLSGGYKFHELEKLSEPERSVLLDSAAVLFLEHNVCFRETDPLNGRTYLVFPELINLKKPLLGDDGPIDDGVAYTVAGSVENVYASLVVLMGYTQTFTRTNQWQNHARYEVGQGFVCGFRQEEERAGELDFVLYFCAKTPAPVRMLFQSLFENFLARRNLTVRRFEPAKCSKGHALHRGVIRESLSRGAKFAFCNQCGKKITLPKADQPIQLTTDQAAEVEANRRAADQRSRFEQVLFRLKTHVTEHKIASPECFISYAWGIPEHEQWVERRLAADLQKAGIKVVLDRWENERVGASVPRFVERVEGSDRVIVVGTPRYRTKYDNKEQLGGFVVAAEGDLIGKRMIGTEAAKESVAPVLLAGTAETSFPPLLQGRVHADFRKTEDYFKTALGLFLNLYRIPPTEPVSVELRESLKGTMD